MQPYEFSLDFAQAQDHSDALRAYRDAFHLPKINGKTALYFCGNSLGLQPKSTRAAVLYELDQWSELGVEGHFHGKLPWMHYHKFLQEQAAHIVGAQRDEVVVMNTLTTNLHLLMVSFYRPNRTRFKIIMEAGAFPSDQYALETQARYHGLSPEEAIVEVAPRAGEETLHTEDILAVIEAHGAETALVLFGGVNYYTGQYYDLKAITEAGHRAGALVGFDLAHAAGNVPLQLHDWGADFAVWCSYKYLNSGPGGPGGVFVHERHANSPDLPRFAGWWGHDEDSRFLMRKGFQPMKGAAGWQLSNAQILSFAAHKASLDIFYEAGMPALREKSLKLTAYLEFVIQRSIERGQDLRILTPSDPVQRGCQLSVRTGSEGRRLFDYLAANGVLCDWREDNLSGKQGGVIRMAPTPLYNRFEDVYELGKLLEGFV